MSSACSRKEVLEGGAKVDVGVGCPGNDGVVEVLQVGEALLPTAGLEFVEAYMSHVFDR